MSYCPYPSARLIVLARKLLLADDFPLLTGSNYERCRKKYHCKRLSSELRTRPESMTLYSFELSIRLALFPMVESSVIERDYHRPLCTERLRFFSYNPTQNKMAARIIRSSLTVSRSIVTYARPAVRPVVARAAWAQPISRTFIASATRLGSGESAYRLDLRVVAV